jgi:hypothetical protein
MISSSAILYDWRMPVPLDLQPEGTREFPMENTESSKQWKLYFSVRII